MWTATEQTQTPEAITAEQARTWLRNMADCSYPASSFPKGLKRNPADAWGMTTSDVGDGATGELQLNYRWNWERASRWTRKTDGCMVLRASAYNGDAEVVVLTLGERGRR